MEFVDPIYDKKDLPRFRKALKKQVNGDRNLLFFEIGLATALRPGDVMSLKVEDVKTGIIRIRASKTGKFIELHLNDNVMELVKAYIQTMDDDEKLFTFNRSTANRFLKKAAGEIGLTENIGCHSLRKTRAFHMYQDSNFDIRLVMDVLQHDEAGSTLHYIGWRQEKMRKEMSKYEL